MKTYAQSRGIFWVRGTADSTVANKRSRREPKKDKRPEMESCIQVASMDCGFRWISICRYRVHLCVLLAESPKFAFTQARD
jgi:hypothetical protein